MPLLKLHHLLVLQLCILILSVLTKQHVAIAYHTGRQKRCCRFNAEFIYVRIVNDGAELDFFLKNFTTVSFFYWHFCCCTSTTL